MSSMQQPFISIITATRNAADTLPRLLDSLSEQSFRDFELVLQDGGSTDTTIAIAESYRNKLPFLSLVSEPDSGIYDAWNKAITRVRGAWVLFLGADDALVDTVTLADTREILAALPEHVSFCAGDVIMCDGTRDVFTVYAPADGVIHKMRSGNPIVYAGLFHRVRIFEIINYDTAFRFIGDYDFLCRAWQRDSDGVRLGLKIVRMETGGATNSLRHLLRSRYEVAQIAYRHFGLRGAFPHLPGLIKGIVPFALSRLFSPEKAVKLYNRLRAMRHLPPMLIK